LQVAVVAAATHPDSVDLNTSFAHAFGHSVAPITRDGKTNNNGVAVQANFRGKINENDNQIATDARVGQPYLTGHVAGAGRRLITV
jgi:hypothetical protein